MSAEVFVVICMMRGYDDDPGSDTFHVVGTFTTIDKAKTARDEHDAIPVADMSRGANMYHMLSFYTEVVRTPLDGDHYRHLYGA